MVESSSPTIKICGLGDAVSAEAAIAGGATAIGFMMAESRRQVQPSMVSSILSVLPSRRPRAVGITVNEPIASLAAIVTQSGIDIIQLSGDEAIDVLDAVDLPVWKALRFDAGTTVDEARRTIEPWLTHARPVAAILLDASLPGFYGGTGHRADWALAAELADRYPVVLAGGLTPGNVAEAIETVRPMGVDVSSGVEIGGRKDVSSIQRFISSSQAAFASVRVN